MQITLGTTAAVSAGTSGKIPALPGSGTDFKSLLGSVQVFGQNAELLVPAAAQPAAVDSPAGALFQANESLQALLEGHPELEKLAAELVEEGNLPSLQEVAVLLQTDVQTLTDALQKVFALFNSQEAVPEEVEKTPLQTEGQAAVLEPIAMESVPVEQLAGLIEQISKGNAQVPFKEADKQAAELVVRAGQLIQAFAKAQKNESPPLKQLKSALENGAALFAGSSEKAAPSVKQAVLQTAFQQYSSQLPVKEEQSAKPSAPLVQTVESSNPFLTQMSKTEQFVMSVKTNPRPMNMEQFIEKFQQILGGSSILKTANGTKMLIKLYPEQLGSLRIELLQQNGVMTAKILSSTQAVKELLEQNSHQLKQAFNQQNVTVEKLDITSAEAKQQLYERGSQQQRQEQKQQHEERPAASAEETAVSFEELLENAELEV